MLFLTVHHPRWSKALPRRVQVKIVGFVSFRLLLFYFIAAVLYTLSCLLCDVCKYIVIGLISASFLLSGGESGFVIFVL